MDAAARRRAGRPSEAREASRLGGVDEFTLSERRAADLAAHGRTNREIARGALAEALGARD